MGWVGLHIMWLEFELLDNEMLSQTRIFVLQNHLIGVINRFHTGGYFVGLSLLFYFSKLSWRLQGFGKTRWVVKELQRGVR